MKFLRKFQTDSDRTSFEGSNEYKEPYVSLVKEDDSSHYNKPFLCKLTLNDGSSIKLYGNGQLTSNMIRPYKETVVSAKIGDLCTSIGGQAFSGCTAITTCTIGNDSIIGSIGDNAFRGCSSLTSINIPSGVTNIGGAVFNSCTAMTTCTIGNDSLLTSIGGSAFQGCSSLTSINIPSGVTSVGDYAFYNCSSLSSITVNATTPPTLGSNVFNNTNNCPIYVPSESVEAYKAATNWNIYTNRIQTIP